ncbi:hypothetical protein BofuT4_uP090580.1 [Botrytis cinerea T4]|uniref:Uncharacterized protein n=1 Tax=Botryotinia fuckeliana (strain T4) TaxID=999810 RepID=G2YEX8_BOTF4|nr:hypothetical protein BofuT4_uP090580.1 [Botrytis cinerea T4]
MWFLFYLSNFKRGHCMHEYRHPVDKSTIGPHSGTLGYNADRGESRLEDVNRSLIPIFAQM